MNKLTITLLILLTSFISSAGVISTAVVITDKSLQITHHQYFPRVYINGVELDGAALGCENNTPVISLGEDNPLGEMMYNTLLAAKESGRTVLISANKCWDGYSTPQVFSISTY